MTIANTFAAKLSVAFVAIAMALTMIAPAQAQTSAELQAQIDSLLATITALQAQLGVTTTTTTTTSTSAAYVFTRSLTIGAQGADVTALQTYLIAGGYAIPAGATGYFGTQTQAAVAAWQAANGVTPTVGYFGPISQAKYTALMAAVVVVPPTGTGTGTGTGTTVTLNGGEASIDNNFNNKSGDDTDLTEGQEDAPVADVQFDVKDGDIQINRMDVAVDHTAGTEADPWDTFETVSLWVDGDQIASMDAGSKSDWEKDQPNNGDYRLRFTGLDQVFKEGDKATITIGVTLKGSIGDHSGTWDIFVPTDGIRGVDGAGIQEYTGDTSDTTSFDFSQKGNDDQIIVKTSSTNPAATTLEVKDNSKSDWTTVLAYDLDTKDSVNDITLTTLPVGVVVGSSTFNHFVSDAELVVDGVTYTDWSFNVTNGGDAASGHTQLDFNIDDNTTINAGDRVTVELKLKFNSIAAGSADEGTSIHATSTGDLIDATGADTLDAGQLSGAVTGETHTLRTSGAVLEAGAMTSTIKVNDTTDATDDQGVFTLKFDVTAFNTDLYINKTAASSTGATNGASFRITNGSGAGAGTSTAVTASLSSTASSEVGSDTASRYVVHEGETKTFTVTVNYNPNNVGAFYGIQLYSLNYATTNDGATASAQRALPATDYETDPLAI